MGRVAILRLENPWRDSTSQLEATLVLLTTDRLLTATQLHATSTDKQLCTSLSKRFTQPLFWSFVPSKRFWRLLTYQHNCLYGILRIILFSQLDALLIHMDNIPSQLCMFRTGQGTKNTTVEVKDVLRPWNQVGLGKLVGD